MFRVVLLLSAFLLSALSIFALPAKVYVISYADPSAAFTLSVIGEERAALLAPYFTQTLPASGYPVPTLIVSAQPSSSSPGPASVLTVAPTSAALNSPIHTQIANDVTTVVNFVLNSPLCNGQVVLITWDFYTIPNLIAALGFVPPVDPVPPCYSRTYVLGSFPGNGAQPSVLNQNFHTGDPACGGTPVPNPPTPNPPPSPIPPGPGPGPAPAPTPAPNAAFTQVSGWVPFGIQNGTGLPDSQVFFLTYTADNQVITFTNTMGNLLGAVRADAAIPTGSNQTLYLSSTYGIPLSSMPTQMINGVAYRVIYLPNNVQNGANYSGRMQFSVYQQLPWSMNPPNGRVSPGDGSNLYNTYDPSYYTIQDKLEYDFSSSLVWLNNTWGDFFGLPMAIQATQTTMPTTQYSGINPTVTRQAIINSCISAVQALSGHGAGTWQNLINTFTNPSGSGTTYLRVNGASFASGQSPTSTSGVNTPASIVFPTNYVNSNPYSSCQWVTTVWANHNNNAYYQLNDLYINMFVTTPGYYGKGRVDSAGAFVFNIYAQSDTTSSNSLGTVVFPIFSSCDRLFNGNPPAGTQMTGQASRLNAAVAIWQIFACAFEVGFHPVMGTSHASQLQEDSNGSSTTNDFSLRSNKASYFVSNPFGPSICTGPWYDLIAQALLTYNVAMYAPWDKGYYTSPYSDVLQTAQLITTSALSANSPSYFIFLGSVSSNTVQPTPFTDPSLYTVVFNPLGSGTTATLNGMPIASTGQTFNNVSGTNMALNLTFTAGTFNGTTFNLTLSPQTQMSSPKCAAGTPTMTLAGTTLTVTLPGAPM